MILLSVAWEDLRAQSKKWQAVEVQLIYQRTLSLRKFDFFIFDLLGDLDRSRGYPSF